MAVEIGSMMVALRVNQTELERGMKIAGTSVSSFERASAATLSQFDRRFAATMVSVRERATLATAGITTFAKGIVAAAIPVLGLSAAIATAKAGLKDFGDIADASRASGLDPELFQAIAFAAKQSGLEFTDVASALQSFNKNAGLAVAQKGRMYAALKTLNPELLRNLTLATSQEERVKAAADAISKESDASRRAALSTTLFGDAGAKMAEIFSGGAKGIDDWLAKAKAIGAVVDRDLIARADDMGDAFDVATRVLDLQFKEILVELAPYLTSTAQGIAEIVKALRGLGSTEAPGVSTEQLEQDIADYKSMLTGDHWLWDRPGTTQKLSEAQAELARRSQTPTGTAPETFDFRTVLDRPAPSTTGSSSGYGDPNADERAKAALRQADAVKQVIDALQLEQSMIGKSSVDQRVANEVRKAGAGATMAQRSQIEQMVRTIATETDALENLKAQFDQAEGLAKDFAGTLIDDLEQGKSAAESLSDAFANLGKQLISIAANQAISGLFSNLFSAATGGGGGGLKLGYQAGVGGLLGGSIIPGILHSGGVAGRDGAGHGRAFSPATWLGAPRYHSGTLGAGLRPGEIPAILKQGELVDPGDGSVFNKVAGRGSVLNITIDARGAGPDVEQRLRQFARFELPVLVRKAQKDPYAVG